MKRKKSPPTIDNSSTPVLNPPKTLLERPFNFAFNSVNLIASNPLLPLQLWIIKTPTSWRRPICWLAFLELGIIVLGLLSLWRWRHWRSITCTITPEILHSITIEAGSSCCCCCCWPIVIAYLHSSITAWFGSEIFHHAFKTKTPMWILSSVFYIKKV